MSNPERTIKTNDNIHTYTPFQWGQMNRLTMDSLRHMHGHREQKILAKHVNTLKAQVYAFSGDVESPEMALLRP